MASQKKKRLNFGGPHNELGNIIHNIPHGTTPQFLHLPVGRAKIGDEHNWKQCVFFEFLGVKIWWVFSKN